MPTRVKLPDGSFVNVPTDDRQAAARAAQQYWAKKQKAPKAAPKEGFLDTVGDFAGNVLDNAVPNWGDEYAGFWGGVGSKISGGTFREGYDRESAGFKARQKRYKARHKVASAISTGAGMVGGMVLPAGRALEGANLARRAGQGLAVGAAYGGAAGAGEGDNLAERGVNAANGAVMGAAVGGAMAPAAAGAQSAGRWARRNVPGVDAATRAVTAIPQRITQAVTGRAAAPAGEEQANRMLGEQLRRGQIDQGYGNPGAPASPDAVAAEVARRQAQGVPAMVGDVTPELRDLTEYAGRGMGPGQRLVRSALDRRQAQQASRVRQHVQETMPTTQDPIRYVDNVTQEAREAAAPLYREAYDRPMYRTEAIQGIERTPAFRDAVPQAYRNIRNQIDPETGQPLDPRAMGFRDMPNADPNGLPPNMPTFPHPDGDGYVAYDRGLSTEGYDQVVRAMNDAGRSASHVNPVTGRIESTTNSVHINARAQDLRQALREQNPPYDEAVSRYGDGMAHREAFNQGSEVGTLTGHEVNAQNRSMPELGPEAWSTGAGTAMADEAAAYGAKYPTGNTANRVRQMLGDDGKQAAIENMNGNRGNVPELLNRLEGEQQAHLNWQGTNGNSRTAQRQQLDNDLDMSAGVPTSKDGIVTRLIGFIADRAVPQYQQDVKRRIAEVVTASDAATVQDAMTAIERQVENDRAFRDMLHKAGVATSALYGANVKPAE